MSPKTYVVEGSADPKWSRQDETISWFIEETFERLADCTAAKSKYTNKLVENLSTAESDVRRLPEGRLVASQDVRRDHRHPQDIPQILEPILGPMIEGMKGSTGTMTLYVHLTCLPDTIDPRGPKGK
jgi:hypothetical protein